MKFINGKQEKERVTHIKSTISWKDINLYELYEYRDLIRMLVERYFTTIYKQTILGPLWIIINPLITTLMYSLIFGNIARISTDGMPYLLFYMSGTTMWSLFSSTLQNASNTLIANAGIFGKVYFPRLAAPVASTICACVNYIIQFAIFILIFLFYLFTENILVPSSAILLVPALILQTAALGMSIGVIIASWTVKYRDLGVLISFALQLWMYATPVVYPLSVTGRLERLILMLNPMSPIIEAFRYAFMGVGEFSPAFLSISGFVTVIMAAVAIPVFNRAEKTSVDTI
ncbi:MAG: ABC transporter permease [Oscillospiraceae bacterium]|nr:ABC transporter permease [Oscillospiraceae bacterium]